MAYNFFIEKNCLTIFALHKNQEPAFSLLSQKNEKTGPTPKYIFIRNYSVSSY